MNRFFVVLLGLGGALIGSAAGCASWQENAQTALDAGTALCTNTLLRSEVPKMLIASGVLPETVSATIESACAVLAASKPGIDALLEQADKARTPRARMLEQHARARGLL